MQPVQRQEVLDYVTYDEQRESFRAAVMNLKQPRRVHVGAHLTFLFENHDTVLYQIQEMIRVERIVKEADIQHEIDTYNELLGTTGELGCVLLIEIDDEEERKVKLREWKDLPDYLYALLEDGSRASFTYDERQVDSERVSSVQYLKVNTGGKVPVAIGVNHPAYTEETQLSKETSQALQQDLAA